MRHAIDRLRLVPKHPVLVPVELRLAALFGDRETTPIARLRNTEPVNAMSALGQVIKSTKAGSWNCRPMRLPWLVFLCSVSFPSSILSEAVRKRCSKSSHKTFSKTQYPSFINCSSFDTTMPSFSQRCRRDDAPRVSLTPLYRLDTLNNHER